MLFLLPLLFLVAYTNAQYVNVKDIGAQYVNIEDFGAQSDISSVEIANNNSHAIETAFQYANLYNR